MNARDEIAGAVARIALERELKQAEAFGYWFLEEIENKSQEDALDEIPGGL